MRTRIAYRYATEPGRTWSIVTLDAEGFAFHYARLATTPGVDIVSTTEVPTADYVVTLAPDGDDRTDGLRRMTLADATTVALDAVAAGKHPRVLLAAQ